MTLKRVDLYDVYAGTNTIQRKVGRRGHQVWKRETVRSRGTVSSADLGGSSNYSSVTLED